MTGSYSTNAPICTATNFKGQHGAAGGQDDGGDFIIISVDQFSGTVDFCPVLADP